MLVSRHPDNGAKVVVVPKCRKWYLFIYILSNLKDISLTKDITLGLCCKSHCPTNDLYNICIQSCCLPCNYVTKPFGILQRVIKSQRVYIYHLDSAKSDTFSLRKVKAAKFSENFNFKFSGLMKRYKKFRPYKCAVFKKEMFLLCPYDEMYSQFKLLVETFSYFVR